MNQTNLKSVIRRYFAFQFFFSLLLWLPVFYEFQKRIGLNDSQIFGIQSIYYIVFALLEIPTGVFADRVGTRHCMRLGAVVLFVASLLPAMEPNYTGMLIHFLLIALSRSLISGASSAYLYDYLKHFNAAAQYKQIEGAARSYSLIGRVVCWAIVGALMEWHLTLPYLLTAVSSAVAIACAFSLPTIPKNSAVIASVTLASETIAMNLVAVLRNLLKSPLLIVIMVQGVALFVMVRVMQVNLFQPMLGSKSFPVASYGMVMSLMTVFEAIGSAKPSIFNRRIKDLNLVFVLSLAMAVCLGLLPFVGQWGEVACLCVFSWIAGISFPIQKQLVNDSITDSRYRATLISVESIIDRSVCAVAASAIGTYLAAGRLNDFLFLSSVSTAGLMVVLAITIRCIKARHKAGVVG